MRTMSAAGALQRSDLPSHATSRPTSRADSAETHRRQRGGSELPGHGAPDHRVEREARRHERKKDEVHEVWTGVGLAKPSQTWEPCARRPRIGHVRRAALSRGSGRAIFSCETATSTAAGPGMADRDKTKTDTRPAGTPAPGDAKVPSGAHGNAPATGSLLRRRRRLRAPHEGDGARHGGWPRPACLRHGRHHEPAADVGHGARPAGRDVQGREGDRRARRAARLFPRCRRMPLFQVGLRPRRAFPPHDAGLLRGRLHADPQGALARARRSPPASRSTPWSTSAIAWRRTSTTCAAAPASSPCSACPCSCSRKAMTPRPSAPSARSHASPRVPIAVSTRAPPPSSRSCCPRLRSTPPAAARRSPRSAGGCLACCSSSSS